MRAFETLDGLVAPMDLPNVDTDAIIPKQYLKSIKRTGFGPNAFDNWRYLDEGGPEIDDSSRRLNPDFVLNQPRYQGAEVLLARENFGCGSSREHAVWALDQFGFRVVIAPSFADIFFNNAFKSGLLPVILPEAVVNQLFEEVAASEGYRLTVDLDNECVSTPSGERFAFETDPTRREKLRKGLDEIGMTLQHAEAIRAYEAKRAVEAPWLFSA